MQLKDMHNSTTWHMKPNYGQSWAPSLWQESARNRETTSGVRLFEKKSE